MKREIKDKEVEARIVDFVKTFTEYNDYLGVAYTKIYQSIDALTYTIYFDNEGQLRIDENNETHYSDNSDNHFEINESLFTTTLLKDPSVMPITINNYQYIFIGLDDDCHFIIRTDCGKNVRSYLIDVTTNEEGAEKFIEKYGYAIQQFTNDKEDAEFGVCYRNDNSLCTRYYKLTTGKNIDINANYNDDLPYDKIKNILSSENSSDLILLYGEPGTGKSTLIKHFINTIREKDFIFVDSGLLSSVQSVTLLSYLLENNNSVLIFEDCEKLIRSRDAGNIYSDVLQTILNISDGVIADILNIKIICTFNTNVNNIDTALLRKGRLSLKYEFKKLNKEKAAKLLPEKENLKDMTLADIYNYDVENDFSKKLTTKIGF